MATIGSKVAAIMKPITNASTNISSAGKIDMNFITAESASASNVSAAFNSNSSSLPVCSPTETICTSRGGKYPDSLRGSASAVSVGREALVGREGVALTTLRPSGAALIDDERVDVTADGEFIEKGTRIRVIEAEGPRIVVEVLHSGDG